MALLPLAALLLACSNRSASRLPLEQTPATGTSATGASLTATATTAATTTASGGNSGIVGEAYGYLVRELVLPVAPTTLIQAAWDGATAEARQEGVGTTVQLGTLDGDAGDDLAAFEQAFTALLASDQAKLDAGKLRRAAATAMAESVRDCHTAYLTPGAWGSIEQDLRGRDTLPELPLTFQLGPPFLVESVVDGSGAAQQGIKPGDQILSADGTPLEQIPLSQRKFLSAGADGSSVRLELQSPDGSRRTLSVKRETVERPVVVTRLIGQVAYLRLRTFTFDLNATLDPTIDALLSNGAKAFVLDLRGNLGGEMNGDVHLLSRFIPAGVLAETSERGGPASQADADGSVLPGPPPLVVLVDGGSLSASELFASDIQQYHAGELVGTPTPGCLLGSSFHSLSDGSAIQVSALAVRVGPQDLVVNNVGVQPDVVLPVSPADLTAGRDLQLDRALADARKSIAP